MFKLSKQFVWGAVILSAVCGGWQTVHGQAANRAVSIDKSGVVRWQDTNEEAIFFGVNYCLPSGYSYRAIEYVGADAKKVVEADMTHLARMGMNAIRLSFWGDWENSDKEGNLVDNVHLELLDHVIAEAGKRGIYMLLTPIVHFSPVWPEPEATNTWQGLSRFYPRKELGVNPKAIEAQKKYLSAIVNHRNRFTQVAYKDDPAVVFIEPVNEPHHHPDNKPVEYMNTLVDALRAAGWQKPIFFNVSQDMAIASAVRDSRMDGVTFGWYPSGLVNGRMLKGNFLPCVDAYRPMFDPVLKDKPKLVYEFDAADIGGSYMYPAMARTYRSAGVQFAAMFSYDPLAIASKNLEYQTHYLNLVYTPNKAVSLMIAARAFGLLPRGQSYGRYPADMRFGPARVSYEQDLSELVMEKEFLYSNTTRTMPADAGKLERVVGCGSSGVVGYEGTGVYFVEKLEAGVWRLEVYPDAVWVRDPFGKLARDREVSRLLWREHAMKITLPDLGSDFSAAGFNKDNSLKCVAQNGEVIITPGVYLLHRSGITRQPSSASFSGGVGISEYIVPTRQAQGIQVVHEPPREVIGGRAFEVKAKVVSDEEPKDVTLYYRASEKDAFKKTAMRKVDVYCYAAELAAEEVRSGSLGYAIAVRSGQEAMAFPAQVKEVPQAGWQTVPAPVVLYHAETAGAAPKLEQWSTKDASVQVVAGEDMAGALQVKTAGFEARGAVAVTVPLASAVKDVKYEDAVLVVGIRALTPETNQVQLTLTDKFKMERQMNVSLSARPQVEIELKDVCIADLVSAKFTIGAWLYPGHEEAGYGFAITKIAVLPSANVWQVDVVSEKAPFVLFDAKKDTDRLWFPNTEHKVQFTKRMTVGMTEGSSALRVDIPTLKPSPHDVSFRLFYDNGIEPRRKDLAAFDVVRIRARGGVKETDRMELALIGRNGTVYGAKVTLTEKWRDIEIPLKQFLPIVVTFLPRPYPTVGFDYWDQGDWGSTVPLDMSEIEAMQISVSSRLFSKFTDTKHAVEIESVRLEAAKTTGP